MAAQLSRSSGVQCWKMKDQEQDDLWELLGKAKRSIPSPFFATKVVAAARRADEKRRLLWRNWLRYGLPGALAGAMAVFFAHFSVFPHRAAELPPVVVAQTEPGDLEVIADLDFAISSEESSVWLDSSAH
jgi:hypothetical protein